MRFAVNGKAMEVSAKPGSYADVSRTWHTGDKLEVTLPMTLHVEAMPDNPNRIALFNGPILLAGELGPEKDPKMLDSDYVPVLRTDAASLLKQIKPVKGQTNVFRTEGIGKPRDVTLQPFYRTHHERYAVYWDLVTPQQLTAREAYNAAEQKHRQQLQSLTVDAVTAGDTNSEAGHDMKGEKLEVDEFNNRPYRLSRGGWFSYQLKVPSDKAAALVCTYWGGERGHAHL